MLYIFSKSFFAVLLFMYLTLQMGRINIRKKELFTVTTARLYSFTHPNVDICMYFAWKDACKAIRSRSAFHITKMYYLPLTYLSKIFIITFGIFLFFLYAVAVATHSGCVIALRGNTLASNYTHTFTVNRAYVEA